MLLGSWSIEKMHVLKRTGDKLHEDSKTHYFCTPAVGCFIDVLNGVLKEWQWKFSEADLCVPCLGIYLAWKK